MRPISKLFFSLLLIVSSLSPANAANIHFVDGSASAVVDASGVLIVRAKIAGLGKGDHEWTISGSNLTITAGCRNNAGHFPNGTQKLSGSLLGYYISATGNVSNGSLSIFQQFAPPLAFINSCPSGQAWVIRQVSGNVLIFVDSPVRWTGSIAASLQ